MARKLLLSLIALCLVATVSCGGGVQKTGVDNSKKTYAISTDSADRPGNEALLKMLYPDDPKARVDFCSPILVDNKKYYFVQASHGFFDIKEHGKNKQKGHKIRQQCPRNTDNAF